MYMRGAVEVLVGDRSRWSETRSRLGIQWRVGEQEVDYIRASVEVLAVVASMSGMKESRRYR